MIAKTDSNIRLAIYTFFFFFSIYLFTGPGHISETDGYVRYLVAKNIIEHKTVVFEERAEEENIKPWLVENTRKEKISFYGLGQTMLFMPLYEAGKKVGGYFPSLPHGMTTEFFCSSLNQILMAGLCVFVMLICLLTGYSKKISLIVAAIFGLATYAWPLSRGIMSNVQATFFIIASLLFLAKSLGNGKDKKPGIFFAGFLFGFAFLTREESLIAFPGMALFLFWKTWDMSKGEALSKAKPLLLNGIVFLSGFFIWVAVFYFSLLLSGKDMLAHLRFARALYTQPALPALFGFFISPGSGLLLFSPVNCVSIFGIKDFFKKNKPMAVSFLVIAASYLLFFSRFNNWTGWWCYGPRHIFIIQVFLAICIGSFLNGWRGLTRNKKVLVLSLILLSVAVQVPAVSVGYHRYFEETCVLDNAAGHNLIWEPLYSPIPMQGKNFFKAISNMMAGKKFEWEIDNANPQLVVDRLISYNIIDWWWIYAFYKGIKAVLLLPLFLIFGAIFSLIRIKRLIA